MPRSAPIWLRSPTRARPSSRWATTPADRPSAGRHGRGGSGRRAQPDPGRQFQQPEVSRIARRRGSRLLRVFVGGARRPELAEMDDANCGRWCSTNCRGCCRFAASRATATSPIGRARCRNITSATRNWWRGSRPAWRPCPICSGRQRLSRRRHSRLHPRRRTGGRADSRWRRSGTLVTDEQAD